MPTLTPKQLEIRDREQQILRIAKKILVETGYHGLNMDRIAEEVNYSKGTVYNHFPCKEEVIIALAIQNLERRTQLFRQAAEFKGRPRFRMEAVGVAAEMFIRQDPDFFKFEQLLRLGSVMEKVSEKRQAIINGCEMQCISIIAGVVRAAIANEDLQLPPDLSPEDVVFGLWSLSSGGYSIAFTSESLPLLGLGDPFRLVRQHCTRLMDGFNWEPLSSAYDVDALASDIRSELFSDQ